MKKERFLELMKMSMDEIMSTSVTEEEFDFMLENCRKPIDEIDFIE